MNLKEKLQQLAQERQNLQVAMIEITGAMKILEQQKQSHQSQRHNQHS